MPESPTRTSAGPCSCASRRLEGALAGQCPECLLGPADPRRETLSPGGRLGPYEVEVLLGRGGMGEVYRGRDTRLGRAVALKVISEERTSDDNYRRRFELEARAASALNHPSIVTIYDIGDTGGISWIAMEWVEGRTLRQAIADGPLPLGEMLSITRQIADGLATAHAKGIVHRDLKPDNVMLRADGRCKVLDFGLARQTLTEPEVPIAILSEVETLGGPQTRAGTILGTIGYMSPEQATGRPADFRSDQFALGLIAYEMLVGHRAFARPSDVETLAAIIREDPVPVSTLREGVPASLDRVIATCMAKRPEDRFASTQQLVAALEAVAASPSGMPAALPLPEGPAPTEVRIKPSRRRQLWAMVTALVLALTAATSVWFRPAPPAIDSLAVLPFVNASNDKDAEYLGDGLTETLIDQMSGVSSLKVMARATVFRFKGATDPQEVGRKLGVGAVVAGTVSRQGETLEVSAELVEIATGARLWGERYETSIAELAQVRARLASEIADRLRLRLSAEERANLSRHGTEDPDAYELSLKAAYFLARNNEEDDLEARRLYLQALEKDPKFVDARLGVASTYARSAGSGYAPPGEAWARADEEYKKALALDPGNVRARSGRAAQRFARDWDWAGAEREFRELSADPRIVLGPQFHPIAMFFLARGRPEEAVALVERALEVDPENLESRLMLAGYLTHAGRLEEAMAHYRRIGRDEPSHPSPLLGLAELLKRRGDLPGAIAALRKAYELSGEQEGTVVLANARTEKDYEDAEVAVARSRIARLQALADEGYVSPLDFARLHSRVGDREQAFAALESALAERSPRVVLLKADRAWDGIRDDPRFAAAVRRVGIP